MKIIHHCGRIGHSVPAQETARTRTKSDFLVRYVSMPTPSPRAIIAGTVGLDTIATPFGSVTDALGGSAVYASLAASLFSPTGLIGIAGMDFPAAYQAGLEKKVDLAGLAKAGETFRWSGAYEYTMEAAQTKDTKLGSLAGWQPVVPDAYKQARVFFIGNLDPAAQHQLLDWAHRQHPRPYLMLDTMNYWITSALPRLGEAIERVDCFICNDQEARMLADTSNLIVAGRALVARGPGTVIIKKGEHGALLFSADKFFAVPGYPLSEVKDPTGAGDSFAGALAGFLASQKSAQPTFDQLIHGIVHATVTASFTTEALGTERLAGLSPDDVRARLAIYTTYTQLTTHSLT